ncbi:hypothetical protein ACTEV4_001866 [Cronobacter turicensis]
MARPDWGALQNQFLADHARTGISPRQWCEARGLNYSTAKRHIKIANGSANSQKKTANKNAHSQKEKRGKSATGTERVRNSKRARPSPASVAKPIRGKRTSPPTNAFQAGNQHALRHGGYARRMLLSDAVTEDAALLTLDDELFWLRAANLTAAENIGRWRAALDDAEAEEIKKLLDDIGAAQKAMHRNTARIESLELTKAAIEHRMASAEKANLDADKLRKELAVEPEENEPTPVTININVVDARVEGDDGNITDA